MGAEWKGEQAPEGRKKRHSPLLRGLERALLPAAFDFAIGMDLAQGSTGKGTASAVPLIATQDAGFSP